MSIKAQRAANRSTFRAPGTDGHVVVTQSNMTHMQFVFGAVLIYVAIVALALMSGFGYVKEDSQRIEPMTAISTNMSFEHDPGQAVISYDEPEPETINTGESNTLPSYQSDKFNRLKEGVKHDGVVVPVKEDGSFVPRDIVALAIEDNKNFYPRYDSEFELLPKDPEFDAGGVKQRSMFDTRVPSFLGLGDYKPDDPNSN